MAIAISVALAQSLHPKQCQEHTQEETQGASSQHVQSKNAKTPDQSKSGKEGKRRRWERGQGRGLRLLRQASKTRKTFLAGTPTVGGLGPGALKPWGMVGRNEPQSTPSFQTKNDSGYRAPGCEHKAVTPTRPMPRLEILESWLRL